MKSIIITGASRGIGQATAKLLAQDYDYMALCCRSNTNKLNETAQIIRSAGCSCSTFTGNISDYGFAKEMVTRVIAEAGHIDALINNAGVSSIGLFMDLSPEDWDEMIRTNLYSVFNTCRLVIPDMIKNHSGRIINISSVWGLSGASCEVAYSASKGAINSFTKALAKEVAPSNVSANAVAFGAIDTDMNSHLSEAELEQLKEEIPYGRLASTEEAADCIRNLLNMPEYYTGDILKFDGGWI